MVVMSVPVFATILAAALSLVGIAVLGFVYPVSESDLDDSDCQIASEHDERPAECEKHCRSIPMWYGFGSRKDCYWDDTREVQE